MAADSGVTLSTRDTNKRGLLATMSNASLVRQPAAVEKVLILTYLGIDMIVFTFSVILLWKMDVEK
ncbi:MAG: hypothetical protein IJ198_15065 [Lachnospiraceae bacterium]|nr:hypothetical protein [Lachnospiraceae bacterium]